MSNRVVFKDGHVEEIIKFTEMIEGTAEYCEILPGHSFKVNKHSSKETNAYLFTTESGTYVCATCPYEGNEVVARYIKYIDGARKLNDSGTFDEISNIKRIECLSLAIVSKPTRPSIDDYYLNIAKAVCKRSTCMRRHYGAVIVKNGEIISTGYNGSPRGEDNCCDTGVCGREGNAHNDGDYRKCPAVHAEMNALLSAARKDTIGATLYLYGEDADGSVIDASPCPICDALIHNSGIENIVASNANWSCD